METKAKYGISEWNNADDICERLESLFSQPVRRFKRSAIEHYMEYFNEKCKSSKKITEKSKKIIPGSVQHNLALNHPFPLVIKKAAGAHMWDIDGNQYIDFLQAGGPTVLGSNYKPVRDKVIELLNDCGPVTGLFHEYEYKLAELVKKHMPSVEMFRMLGSGTESVIAAIRISREYTGNKKVIKIGSAYHGWSDQIIYDIRQTGSKGMYAIGIPEECYAHTQSVPVNDIEALETQMKRNKQDGGTACVLVEPIGPGNGTRPVYFEYNQQIRDLCNQYGALLIFDEVVTGFRVGMGGAQGYFGVDADITVFGKALTGGYPAAGGIGGKKEIISCLAPGLGSTRRKVMVGGTLSANPMSCVAGYYSLLEIEKNDACVKAGRAGDRLTKGLQRLIKKYDLPFLAYNQGSICHFDGVGNLSLIMTEKNADEVRRVLKERAVNYDEMGMAMMAEGLVTIAASRLYTSMADTDDIIDEALARFERLLENIE